MLKMLTLHYFPFLGAHKGAPQNVFPVVTRELRAFIAQARTRLLDLKKEKPEGTEDDQVIEEAYQNLRMEMERNRVLLSDFLFELAEMDLYRLHKEWQHQKRRAK